MRVTVKVGGPLRSAVGSRKVALELPEGATVADLLSSLAIGILVSSMSSTGGRSISPSLYS